MSQKYYNAQGLDESGHCPSSVPLLDTHQPSKVCHHPPKTKRCAPSNSQPDNWQRAKGFHLDLSDIFKPPPLTSKLHLYVHYCLITVTRNADHKCVDDLLTLTGWDFPAVWKKVHDDCCFLHCKFKDSKIMASTFNPSGPLSSTKLRLPSENPKKLDGTDSRWRLETVDENWRDSRTGFSGPRLGPGPKMADHNI